MTSKRCLIHDFPWFFPCCSTLFHAFPPTKRALRSRLAMAPGMPWQAGWAPPSSTSGITMCPTSLGESWFLWRVVGGLKQNWDHGRFQNWEDLRYISSISARNLGLWSHSPLTKGTLPAQAMGSSPWQGKAML